MTSIELIRQASMPRTSSVRPRRLLTPTMTFRSSIASSEWPVASSLKIARSCSVDRPRIVRTLLEKNRRATGCVAREFSSARVSPRALRSAGV